VNAPEAGGRTLVMGLVIAVEGGLALLAMFLGRVLRQPPLETLALSFADLLIGLGATVPLLLMFFALLRWPVGPVADTRKFILEVLCPILAPCTVADLAAISLLAGLGEEMLFRGTLQAEFVARFGPWAGLAMASLLFGLLHAVTPAYAVLATLMGAYLGWLWQLNGNILTPIIVHALYDFVALWYLLAGPGRSLWEKQRSDEDSAEGGAPKADTLCEVREYFAASGAPI
jgi:membrane protease YdiL (CAAX protease family)